MNLPYITLSILLASVVRALPKDSDHDQHKKRSIKWGACELEGIDPKQIKLPIDCAKLPVPLDYTDPDCSEKVPLQLIKIDATKKPVLGSVLFNPGGRILGGQYNLIGFDPRGTGRTIPFACNVNWTEAPSVAGLKRRSDIAHRDLITMFNEGGWDDSAYVAETCYEAQKSKGSFLSTAFVARDMKRIIEAIGEDGKLRFWGASYGTLLGQTFAAMFPEYVDRMVLDSVVEGKDYMEGFWLRAMEDTDKTLEAFFSSCIAAGPDLCPLAILNGPDTTAEWLLSSFNSAVEHLHANPLLAPPTLRPAVWNPTPETTLDVAIKAYIFATLYHATKYPQMSALLTVVLTKNFTAIIEPTPLPPAPSVLPWNIAQGENFWGTACTDASFRASSPEEMHPLVKEQATVSDMADGFMGKLWPCAQWKMKAAERYTGDFKAKTKFPILFVNGKLDPCTPWASAESASKNFDGSVLLTHGGHGHKFFRHPSICTAKAVRSYFVDGKLPKDGTVCEPDVGAFEVEGAGGEGPSSKLDERLKARGMEDERDRRLFARMLEFNTLDS
ncbi:hypothetical protein AJ79_02474 [Helicocarpus griseus UAMH5409]|uniref:Peptidase S33 tripeptidyl aminopeptidase-like C-terminal domain-containing protein n=1 Tax=Helicocarpus griseus UAMH5409 TaxID=1447875 RepID=A0A2B7Y2E9_9EURO|nr:hypothetical protein AJ79_02474 [Helicocarpus griseus UAMH5409]